MCHGPTWLGAVTLSATAEVRVPKQQLDVGCDTFSSAVKALQVAAHVVLCCLLVRSSLHDLSPHARCGDDPPLQVSSCQRISGVSRFEFVYRSAS